MRTFRVMRVSDRWIGNKPCDEAVDSGEKEQTSQNHWIPIYTVSFETLDTLMAFVEKYEKIILDAETLWIYDDYAE